MKLKKLETTEDQALSWDNAIRLEETWREDLPHPTDTELVRVFPEAKEIIPRKLTELKNDRAELVGMIREKLTFIKSRASDEFSRWFWREYVKIIDGRKLLEIDKQIGRFIGLRSLIKGGVPKGKLTQEKIQQSRLIPIESIVSPAVKLRKSGVNYVGLCPFHPDKNPSFFIYSKTNSFYCYGCQKGDDVINYVALSRNLNFVESIRWLTGINNL